MPAVTSLRSSEGTPGRRFNRFAAQRNRELVQNPPLPALNIAALAKEPELSEHTSKDAALTGESTSANNFAADDLVTSEPGTEKAAGQTKLAGQKAKAKVNNTIVRGCADVGCK